MKCKKIYIKNFDPKERPFVYLGIIVEDSDDWITIKTAIRTHRFQKDQVLQISDTDEEFVGVEGK